MLNVLITGANGFVGKAVCSHLAANGFAVKAVVRKLSDDLPHDFPFIAVGEIDGQTDWQSALQKVDAVVHLAARVHVMDVKAADPLAEYRKTNVDGTLNLARQALEFGIKRFIYISTIKVNGEFSLPGQSFTAHDKVNPVGGYALSKFQAELGLKQLAEKSALEPVIIRPPLLYGPGVKANFQALLRYVELGLPLPLGAIHNRRSLLAVPNLADLIRVCLTHPAAAGQTFLASDSGAVSTTELLRLIANAMGKSSRLLPIPQDLLSLLLKLAGKADLAQRLCSDLEVDASLTSQRLQWAPPVGLMQALTETVAEYRAQR
ncbi:MAG: hypothetical protein CTY29_02520 [Methylobacter sp.]|nr:MAG: hypothetical protein CTY29_02520 [Methylobacter sp.]